MTLWVFLGLVIPIMVFGLSIFFFRLSNRNLKLLVAFSGAFLLSLSFNKFIPHIYGGLGHGTEVAAPCGITHEGHTHAPGEPCTDHAHAIEQPAEEAHDHGHSHGHGHNHGPMKTIGLFILLGFFIQLILDYLTKGVEHGHLHSKCPEHGAHDHEHHTHNAVAYWPVLIGLSLHSFLESMPLAAGFAEVSLQRHLLLGIIIHNIPIALVFMSLMLQHKVPKVKSIILLGVFAISGPIGVMVSNLLGMHFVADMDMFFRYSMAVVVGIFLHISTTILFETDENHRFNLLKFIVIVVGALAAMFHF